MFGPVPFYTGATPDGAPIHSADKVRQVLNAAAGAGVAGVEHCVARAAAVPNDTIIIGYGGIIVEGRAALYQGRYADFNDGDVVVNVGPNTTSGEVNHMVVVRVEDPNFEGSRNVMTDPIIFPQVLYNVPAGAETVAEAGYPGLSAEPICRLTIPASTGAITNAMITDLRRIASPRTHMAAWAVRPTTTVQATNSSNWVDWITLSSSTRVPEWASRVLLHLNIAGGVVRNSEWEGTIRIRMQNLNAAASKSTEAISITEDATAQDRRFSLPFSDLLSIPAGMAGQPIRIVVQAANAYSTTGLLQVNAQSTITLDATYIETRR